MVDTVHPAVHRPRDFVQLRQLVERDEEPHGLALELMVDEREDHLLDVQVEELEADLQIQVVVLDAIEADPRQQHKGATMQLQLVEVEWMNEDRSGVTLA